MINNDEKDSRKHTWTSTERSKFPKMDKVPLCTSRSLRKLIARPSPLKIQNESPMFLERIQVKIAILDNEGEFTSHDVNDYCMSIGFIVELLHLKCGRPIGLKDKNPRKRKGTEKNSDHDENVLDETQDIKTSPEEEMNDMNKEMSINYSQTCHKEYECLISLDPMCGRCKKGRKRNSYRTYYDCLACKKEKMVDERHKEVQKASTSKGAEFPMNDSTRDKSENESSSGSEDPNSEGFTKEEMKALRSMINKQVGKAIENVMSYYISQTTDNLKDVIKKELEEFRKGGIMNDYKNDMTTYRDFTACDVPKFDGALDPIASTRWLAAVKGAFRTSNCKEKNCNTPKMDRSGIWV
ncbi:hypothetical protein Tco_1021752 [Tanacetum coccineum]